MVGERERGMLECAAEARRRAATFRERANERVAKRGYFDAGRGLIARAELLEDFATWCECEAGFHSGASVAVIGL
jgi:hypothetical protein